MAQGKSKPAPLKSSNNQHISKPSIDTNASGIADSAISYSAFPEPPSSIPVTPVRSVFGSPGPSVVTFNIPTLPRHGSPQPVGGSIATVSKPYPRSNFERDSSRLPTSQLGRLENDGNSVSASSISPYDWHEGASSIDVDATEDRLLPTSFITSLLRDNSGPRGANRTSYSSDAISNISEMTYPPKNPYLDSLRDSSVIPSHTPSRRQSNRTVLPRPVGGRPQSSLASGGKGHNSAATEIHGTEKPAPPAQSPSQSYPGQTLTSSSSMLSQSTLAADQSEWAGKVSGKLTVYSEVDEHEEESQPDTEASSSSGFATSQTNLAQRRPIPKANPDYRLRASTYSSRSGIPSSTSRISSLLSLKQTFTWRRKPLPPLPAISHTFTSTEGEGEQKEQAPLPDIVDRANRLHGLLEKDFHSHESTISQPIKGEQLNSDFIDPNPVAQTHSENNSRWAMISRKSRIIAWPKANKPCVVLGIFVIVGIITIGTAVGVTAQRNKIRDSNCPSGRAGVKCDLNATCVCTSSPSSSSSSCMNPVGQAILDIIPVMNRAFSTNLTTNAVYTSLWIAQGSVQGSNCVQQVELIDVGPGLDASRQPNRTQWTQSALLWTLTQTQDPGAISQLQDFVQQAPWSQISTSDGPLASSRSRFTVEVAGFSYDFGIQNVTPIPATFISAGQPGKDQISRVGASLQPALDNIYSYAVASSEQRDSALLQYWTQTLHQSEERLTSFKTAFSSSPIILPFDATSQVIQRLYTTNSFPPPIACYPGLASDQLHLIDTIEGTVFGLPEANATTQVDTSCFATRPTYGILDLLRLRLPFLDSQGKTARQGVILNPIVAPRAILAVGQALSGLPDLNNTTRSLAASEDPRNYGTPTYANHIIFQYLSSLSTNAANAVISHILDVPPPTPPTIDESSLFPLDSIPILEVAVFGSIEASDSESYVSSFDTYPNSLFFGSGAGSAFRNWAIGRGGEIAWTENATSPQVVHDTSFTDYIFNSTWLAASIAISTNASNVGLSNITGSFQSNQRFSP